MGIKRQFGWVVRLNHLFLLCVLLALYPFQSQGYETRTMHIHRNNHSFVIKLSANPSTGFQWTIKQYDKTVLVLKTQRYEAVATKRVGVGGSMNYCFSRKHDAGNLTSTTIVFRNARSWEPASSGILQYITVIFD